MKVVVKGSLSALALPVTLLGMAHAEPGASEFPRFYDADFWDAFAYAEFFADHALSRQEGIAALHELKARPGLDDEQKQSLRDALRSAERAAKKDARTKPGKPMPAAPPASGVNS